MEALDDILKKRRSWAVMLDLLKPYIAPQNERMIRPAEEQWNALPLQRQRQIWVTLCYPTPKATADLGHAVGAEIAWCGYQRSSVLRHQRLRANAL